MFGKKRWVGVLVMVSLVVTVLVPSVAYAGRPGLVTQPSLVSVYPGMEHC